MGRGEWLPWTRDWSKHPNIWKFYLFGSVVFAATGVLFLASVGTVAGIGYLVPALMWAAFSWYVFRRSRKPPVDHRPD